MALSSAAPTVRDSPKPPTLNLENLPDPVSDPKEYGKVLGERTAIYNRELNEHYTATQQQQTQGVSSAQLWEDFAEEYDAYAQDQEGVEFATNKVIATAKRRGLDISKYMFANSDRFFRDVVKAYDARFGKPEGDDNETMETRDIHQRRPAKRQEQEDDRDEGRTQGIFGGQESGSQGRAPRPPQPGDMLKDLQDMQRKSGYY